MPLIPDPESKDDHNQYALTLLRLIQDLAQELHPGLEAETAVTLDSALDKDLGFDSLGRMELLTRVEQAFAVTLSESRVMTATTPRELLAAVLSAGQTAAPDLRGLAVKSSHRPDRLDTPAEAQTLQEMLRWHVKRHPDRIHITLYGEEGEPESISYVNLLARAQAVASGLIAEGVEPGQSVALMLPTSKAYFYSFFGVLLAGAIPVPIYPPVRLSQIEEHVRRHATILENSLSSVLITVPEALAVSRLLMSLVKPLRRVVTAASLTRTDHEFGGYKADSGDIAFLQYTSGSTGNPKGVILTHFNLLSNIRGMGNRVNAGSNDVFISWLPLYHDMGLIGAWLGSLYYASPLVIMSPLSFLARPERWLWMIHHHRGTLSAAPNFAYELCLHKINDQDLEGLDLSSWRLAFNGAEPVSPRTILRFQERFEPYGFRPQALAPVYGLAECSVGLAFPPIERGPLIDRVQREPLLSSGRAIAAEKTDTDTLEFVACGQPLAGHQIRIVDVSGRELPDRREGRLEFLGPSATRGYFRNPEATRRLFDGEWLDSGDLAYIDAGEVYLTSRVKDVIIRAGRNVYPYEVEETVGNIPGIRKGCVAVFGSKDPQSETERLIVLAETRETDERIKSRLHRLVVSAATDLLGTPPDEVVLAPPHSVLKTSSGKIRRAASRESYERGSVGEGRRSLWWQVARLALSSLGPRIRRASRILLEGLYALYAWMLFLLLAPVVWVLVALLPGLSLRWKLVCWGARFLAGLTRIPLLAHGLANLPQDGACVLAANHASYLDGILLVATLPTRFHFVAKAELAENFVSRLFLRRIGAEFVERIDKEQGVADAQRLAQVALHGDSIMFFPEGTFGRMPGLLPFRMGAFVAAVDAKLAIVPIGIRGTRSVLRSGSWFPRWGPLSVNIGTPINPKGSDWAATIALRDRTRNAILRLSAEPDLATASLSEEIA